MDEFKLEIIAMATKYLDDNRPSDLSVELAIDQFRDCKLYPRTYSEDKILEDMRRSIAKIVMAVVEIESRNGAEGEISHSESGINRSYGTMTIPKAYATVTPFAEII